MVAADGRFNRIRQVAPMCRSMRAHWRHLANTIELVLPSIRPCTPSTTQTQIDQFSRFCIAHGRKSLHFTWDAPPRLKIAHSREDLEPGNTHGSCAYTRVLNPNGISIGSAIFAWAH